MTCRECIHYLDSADANKPRAGLDGFGYCKQAATPELRAHFFRNTTPRCWLTPAQFKAKPAEVKS